MADDQDPEEGHDDAQDVSETSDDMAASVTGDADAGTEPDDADRSGDSTPSTGADPTSTAGYEETSYHDRDPFAFGQLIVHYPSRDVTFFLDGLAGMRLLGMFRDRQEKGRRDVLPTSINGARLGWVVLDLREPLAMTWVPGLPKTSPRTAVDPIVV